MPTISWGSVRSRNVAQLRERGALGTMQGECCAYARRMGRDETALLAISWQWAPPSLVNALIGPSLVSNDLMISLPIKLPDWIEISETWWSIPRPRSGPVISHDRLTTCDKYFKIFTWYGEDSLPQEGRLLIADQWKNCSGRSVVRTDTRPWLFNKLGPRRERINDLDPAWHINFLPTPYPTTSCHGSSPNFQ